MGEGERTHLPSGTTCGVQGVSEPEESRHDHWNGERNSIEERLLFHSLTEQYKSDKLPLAKTRSEEKRRIVPSELSKCPIRGGLSSF